MKIRYCQCGDPIPTKNKHGEERCWSKYKDVNTCGKTACLSANRWSAIRPLTVRYCPYCEDPIPTTDLRGDQLKPSQYANRKTCMSAECKGQSHIATAQERKTFILNLDTPMDRFILGHPQ